ncbi:MAG TPA: hypothetical protein VFM51_11370 [Solirubrobacterales bacterium]|nr:hypothetical protein [Solirubrobacterales bacterium]
MKRDSSKALRLALPAVLAALSLLVAVSPAGAAGPAHVLGSEHARATIASFHVPTLPLPVRVRELPCPGDPTAQGCHISSRRMDTIWLNPESGGLDSETLAHEMGHVFESYMWDLRWRRAAGSAFVPKTFHRIATVLFEAPPPGILYSTAWSERFAESYSACARFPSLPETLSTGYWGFEMTPADHARICPLIHRMATRFEAATAGDPSVQSAQAL